MPRLPRPTIPIEIKCSVVLKQLGELFASDVIAAHSRRLGRLLADKKMALAGILNCDVADLRLDHDPALGAREKVRNRLGEIVGYIPAANDVEGLFYRPHGPQFDHSHLIKTNVRGDHGQHPDRVLIKRQRRRDREEEPNRKPRYRRPKTRWGTRPMQSANRWPAKGTQKFGRKRSCLSGCHTQILKPTRARWS